MGLDIHIFTDIDEEFFKDDAFETQIQKNRVSRTFCNFMCRENVINHSTELEQIGTITGTDIIPLLKMRDYPDEESIYLSLSVAETGEEKQKVMEEAKADKEKLNGNIDKVIQIINGLIDKLGEIENLPDLLLPTNFDSLGNKEYFSDFNKANGDSYIDNNFGQDLRNFSNCLEFAKSKGAKTVWFQFG